MTERLNYQDVHQLMTYAEAGSSALETIAETLQHLVSQDEPEVALSEHNHNANSTVHIAIGNTDNKLTQQEWANYFSDVSTLVHGWNGITQVFGEWVSPSTAPFQNAAWAFAYPANWEDFRDHLSSTAGKYGQTTVAVNISVTEFVNGALFSNG